mmetsp:Transcript_11356/g.11000  ORF Transcript_11356/g.11000 Transcript_11356/m.11000 type:complete len:938 (+) Transcript_11356:160-2973(+)
MKIFVLFLIFCLKSSDGIKTHMRGSEDRDLFFVSGNEKIKTHVFKHKITGLSRLKISKHARISSEINHEVVFVVKQKNIKELNSILHDVSDPNSANYGQHKTRKEIAELTANPESRDYLVSHLKSIGATVVSETLNGEYITANAPIKVWEAMFHTKFFMFHKTSFTSIEKFVRAEEYYLPIALDSHVESVFNTVQMPVPVFGKPTLTPEPTKDADNWNKAKKLTGFKQENHADYTRFESGTITPDKLKAYYNMYTYDYGAYNDGDNIDVPVAAEGNNQSTQAIYSATEQYFSPQDLKDFQTMYQFSQHKLPSKPMAVNVNDILGNKKCVDDHNNCMEASLDVQYLSSTSKGSPTTFWHSDEDESLHEWLLNVANSEEPPLVFSISYGIEEHHLTDLYPGYMDAFATEAAKLGVMGVTIVAASGDDGANSRDFRTGGAGSCGYVAIFPACSPYVTAVGATQGVENTATGAFDASEIVASSRTKGSITSGGGFSNFHMRSDNASFQDAAVSGYFAKVAGTVNDPTMGYNTQGRGYPDVTAAGTSYRVIIGGKRYLLSGTSASSPFMAGLISNINAKRLAMGKGSIGWFNPTLYQTYTQYTNDITEGDINCVAGTGSADSCCVEGFRAVDGWDPAGGLGSVNYGRMETTLVALGGLKNPDFTPTPTKSPNTAPSPYSSFSQHQNPTPQSYPTPSSSFSGSYPPSASPSFTPSSQALPSASPTIMPSLQPAATASPTIRVAPTIMPSSQALTDPSPKPTFMPSFPAATRSVIEVVQVIAGIDKSTAEDPNFRRALIAAIKKALALPVGNDITNVIITFIESSGRRNMLQAGLGSVSVTYTVSGNLEASEIINKVAASPDELTKELKNPTSEGVVGYPSAAAEPATTTNNSPTMAPTASPTMAPTMAPSDPDGPKTGGTSSAQSTQSSLLLTVSIVIVAMLL